jgi:predicted CXXCH cytochrome family protein
LEEAIGCERCHGLGSLHVAKRAEQQQSGIAAAQETIDHTIVNPAHLSRELAEAVCQQCHLRVSATVLLRGKGLSDFRPGLPLQVFRQDYTLADPDKSMTVVGHVEQMHRSGCYQGSSTFTCVTCHNPHGEPPPEERIAYYKSVCLGCHQPEQCTVDVARREQESADNNCLQCHMPTTPTDIPHLAFTHHRVGIHELRTAEKVDRGPSVLQAFLDDSQLNETERNRALGLAYLDLAIHEDNPLHRDHYQRESQRLLLKVFGADQADGVVLSALASLDFDMGLGEHAALARGALTDPTLDGLAHCNALFLAADGDFRQGRYAEAIAALEPLSRLRRHSLQWLLRAECENKIGNAPGVQAALLQAVAIDPGLTKVHSQLASRYRRQGNEERARYHELRATP